MAVPGEEEDADEAPEFVVVELDPDGVVPSSLNPSQERNFFSAISGPSIIVLRSRCFLEALGGALLGNHVLQKP